MTSARLLIAAALASALATPATPACPVELFREYNPTRPPAILTAPPLRTISVSPYPDPDPEPGGTRLIFYRLGQRVDPDPEVPRLLAVKAAGVAALYWSGTRMPGACCITPACSELCEPECIAASGIYKGDGTSCTAIPPPCPPPATCAGGGTRFAAAKEAGGGVVLGGNGYPTLANMTIERIDPATGVTTMVATGPTAERERVWNFTGALDPKGGRLYFAGGRYNDPTFDATIITIDTTTGGVLQSPNLAPEVNLAHVVAMPDGSGVLYGLALETGGLTLGGGHHYFTGTIRLVGIDPVTGAVRTIASGLPRNLDHFAATFDPAGGRYFYHTFDGNLEILDVTTGNRTTLRVPTHLAGIELDTATGKLYGLKTCCSTTYQASSNEGYRMFGNIDLVSIDLTTGATTVLNGTPLPTGTTNWASAFDCDLGHYLYVGDAGTTNVLDVATGGLVTSAPPPGTSRFHALD